MKSKVSQVLIIICSVIASVVIGGYVFFKIVTSEGAIKAKIARVFEGNIGGELSFGAVDFGIFRGLHIDKIEFKGKGPRGLRINVEKIVLRHEPLALLRGKFSINSITIISPEFFANRDKEVVWKYLFGIKALLDKAKIESPTDLFKGGITVKGANVHIFDETVFRDGSLNIEDLDVFLQPFGGSLRDVNIKGSVNEGYWEGFEFSADANFTTPELKIVVQVRDKFMTEDLMKEVPGVGTKLWETYSSLGRFNLSCLLDFNGENNERKKDFDLVLDITDAEMTYIKWPLLLKHVNGIVEYSRDGTYIKSLKGNIQNEGQEPLGEIDAFFGRGNSKKNIKLTISNINITEKLLKMVPDIGEKILVDYGPKGNIDLSVTYTSNEDKSETSYLIEAICKGVDAKLPNFPFRVSNIVGLIKMDGEDVYFENMSGNFINGTKKNRITFNGVVNLESNESKFVISIPNLDLTEEIVKSIPNKGVDIWSKFKPTGPVGLTVDYTGPKDKGNGEKTIANYSIEAVCKGVEADTPMVPYRLSNILGLLVLDGEHLSFKNMSGSFLDGVKANRVTFDGTVNLKNMEKTFTISVPNLVLTEEIIKSIPEKGREIWSKYKPMGPVDLAIDYTGHEDSSKDDYLITVGCKGNEVEYVKSGIKVSDILGTVTINKNSIHLKNLRGYIDSDKQYSRATCNAKIGLGNNDNKFVFSVFDLKVTEGLLDKFPGLFKKGWVQVETDGWMDITLDYETDNSLPENNYSMIVDAKGCRIGLSGYPVYISDINARVSVEKGVLVSRNFSGTCSGGKIDGSIKINNMSIDGEYTGEINFKELNLKRMLESMSEVPQKLSGICEGNIKFHGKGKGIEGFMADGRAKLKEGYISDVPVLLSILKILNLSIPVKDTFHTADIKYFVKDNILIIEELEVLSNTIELGCLGTIGFDGSLDLTVVVGFNQEIFSQIPLIGQLMDYVVGGVRKKLTKVHLTGTFSNPVGTMLALKPFTHPIKSIFGLLAKGGKDKEDDETAKDEIGIDAIE